MEKFVFLCFSVIFVFLINGIYSTPVVDDDKNQAENLVQSNHYTNRDEVLLEKMNSKCLKGDVSLCLMLKGIIYLDRLLKKSQIEIGGLEILKTKTVTFESANEFSRSFGDDEKVSDEDKLSKMLMDKAWLFVQTRSLKWKVADDAEFVLSGNNSEDGSFNLGISVKPTISSSTSTNAGDARKKKDGGMGLLLGAAALKIGLLKALAFKALALLVGKALLVAKLALVLSVILGLKKLFSQEKHVTYEVVAHPQHHDHHEHSYSSGGGHDSYGHGWSRNFDGSKLAYRAHVPPSPQQ